MLLLIQTPLHQTPLPPTPLTGTKVQEQAIKYIE